MYHFDVNLNTIQGSNSTTSLYDYFPSSDSNNCDSFRHQGNYLNSKMYCILQFSYIVICLTKIKILIYIYIVWWESNPRENVWWCCVTKYLHGCALSYASVFKRIQLLRLTLIHHYIDKNPFKSDRERCLW